jgi:hypothetical protein
MNMHCTGRVIFVVGFPKVPPLICVKKTCDGWKTVAAFWNENFVCLVLSQSFKNFLVVRISYLMYFYLMHAYNFIESNIYLYIWLLNYFCILNKL